MYMCWLFNLWVIVCWVIVRYCIFWPKFSFTACFCFYLYVLICFCINIHIINVLAPKKYGNKSTLWLFLGRALTHGTTRQGGEEAGECTIRGAMLSKVVVPRAAHQWWRAGHRGGPGGAGTSKKTFVGVSIFIYMNCSRNNLNIWF
jgi:hypothetical protein